MPSEHSPITSEEYRALRATIRERGSLRLLLILLTFIAWAALLMAGSGLWQPGRSVVSLLVLAAGFEVVLAAHVGVERVGRYLQHRYESRDGAAWERVAMSFGPFTTGGPRTDPLAFWLFVAATLVNAAAAGIPSGPDAGLRALLAGLWLLHAAFLSRLIGARRRAALQREQDLAAIRAILDSGSSPGSN